ncbi:MAG TPA: 6-phosphogluconolactonase [Vicinamibacterales bacterium]|nr:6-phosphogluconolactonase [Vicinamibacterales bacterium]
MGTHVAATAEDLSLDAARAFARVTSEAVRARDLCFVALSGGSTPRGLYRALVESESLRSQVAWDRIHFFWGDERHVPPDHADSNYRMARETLFASVPVAAEQVHRIRTEESDAAVVARRYEEEIVATLPHDEAVPRFDLILLGLGTDGHTASLFPDTPALAEQRRLCVDNWVERLHTHRITMTFPLLNAARTVLFMVSGQDKAAIVRAVLRSTHPDREFPAQRVRPDGDLLWMLDRGAASALGDAT